MDGEDRERGTARRGGRRLAAAMAGHPTDVHVGQRIRFRRQSLGLSQAKLGQRLGISFQQVQKYERGGNRVSASMLYEIAGVLGVSVAYFFDGLPPPGAGASLALTLADERRVAYAASPEGVRLLERFSQFRPRVRAVALHLFDELAAPAGDGD
jgi:transcriptional regulator with XRE-family HTH domain